MTRANRNTANYNVEQQYICFFDGEIDLAWAMSDVNRFQEMWEAGKNVREIAAILKRHPLEVTLLLIDLAEGGSERVERRPVSIYEGVVQ